MRTIRLSLMLVSFGLAGCLAETPNGFTPDPSKPPVVTPPGVTPVPVSERPGGEVELIPEAPPPEDPTRARRRMDLDQLDSALRTVTGGIGWTERRGNVDVNLFDDLASTLGRPDFLEITEEDLTASAMFQKFLDDAARSACQKLMVDDPRRDDAERTFFVLAQADSRLTDDAAAVQANLRQLLLRFHGRNIGAGSPELEPWLWLMRSAEHVTSDQLEVWRTVCVGLITHPDFYSY